MSDDKYEREASELFWALPQQLLMMIDAQRGAKVERLKAEAVKLQATGLEKIGEVSFTRESSVWPAVLALACATFSGARDIEWVTLKWDPYKSKGAWKISIDTGEGYVRTPDVLQALGF